MIFPRVLNAFALLFLAGAASPLAAQSSGPPQALREAPLTIERLRKSLDEIKADATLDDDAKEAVTKRLEEAVASLDASAHFETLTKGVKNEVIQGPGETASLRKELDQRRAGTIPDAAKEAADLPANADVDMIATRLTSERTRIAEMARQMRDWENQLTELEARPTANRERIVAVTRLLSEAESGFSKWNSRSTSTPQEKADLAFDQTRIRLLRAELAMLEQEALSFDARRDLLQARRDLAASDLGLARERVTRLESRSGALVAARISEAERLINELGLQTVTDDAKVRTLVEESRQLARKNQVLIGKIATADAELNQATEDLARLRREDENIRAQIEIGGIEDSFAEIALELRRTLPTPQSMRATITERRKEISAARLGAFRADRELDTLPSPEGQVEELLNLFREKGAAEDALTKLRPGLNEFVANRTKLRKDSIDGNRRLATLFGEIDLVASETLAAAAALRDFLGERLIWVASSPPLGKDAFTGLRTSFLALLGPQALTEYGRAISRISVGRWLLAGLLAGILLLPRRRLRQRLADSATRTRRISADHIGNTVGALAISLWLALPVPTLMAFFGWIFTSDPQSIGATYALGKGLMAPALVLLVFRFLSVLCWPGGVAEAHFRWKRSVLDPLHRTLIALIFLYLPAHLLLAIWWDNGGDLSSFQGPGRLVFITAMFTLTLILKTFFRGDRSIVSQLESSKSRLVKLRRLWMTLALIAPLALAVLAAMGHFLTAMAMAYLMQKTALVILGGVLSYAFLNRWAALRARRMALADALAEREARRAALEKPGEGALVEDSADASTSEETHIPIEEDAPVDWDVVGEQTRHLIRAVVTLVAIFGCWLAWSEALPALKYLDSRTIIGEISLSDIIWLGIIGIVTVTVFQNLPGLLEIGFLRALELEPGVRNAFVTICQYVVIAIGTAIAFEPLGLDWSKFGWIAAALSVGLGFGLQEVVANFVSGLILLFERPIRVGDIVTVSGVDGVVTKIRIRATTITNWDKKEFIVPNKEFVTGTIMNWTLSSPVTRLVFPVGIAYGSDIAKARDILLEIAHSQPEVLSDPKPAAVFDQFADSSLNFTLRCFLANTDQRLEMTHRINSLIHDRFAEAGIEIPFPQRVVHMRTGESPDESEKKA